jgi:osmotically-inducible protein OsmY
MATGTLETKKYDDEEIKNDIVQKLYWSDFQDASRIIINVSLGEVTLEGMVNSYKAREAAVKYALSVHGVSSVINKLAVVNRQQNSVIDDYIKTRIISLLNYNSYFEIQDIHIGVTNGTVKLEGTIDALWKKTVVNDIIGNINGVEAIQNNLTVVPAEEVADEKISEEIKDAIVRGVGIKVEGMVIDVTNGVVTLSGALTSWEIYNAIYTAVLFTTGVKDVIDKLIIKNLQAANMTRERIRQRVQEEIQWDARLDHSQINVSMQNNIVVLSGYIPSYNQKLWAKAAALRVRNVNVVNNELIIKPTQTITDDVFIKVRIENILKWNSLVDIQELMLSIESGFVVIEGAVDAYWKKMETEKMLLNVIGVLDIVNKLSVVPKEKINDKILVRMVVSAIERKAAVNIADVDVRINNGTVTLFGIVPSWQARNAAHDAACYTRGVVEVKNYLVVE